MTDETMTDEPIVSPGRGHWRLEDIPFDTIDTERAHQNTQLFYMLTVASFVEITSDLYTGNLVRYFAEDREVRDWLQNQWEPEEIQHGAALRRYVNTVWPEFDWDTTYRSFHGEYAKVCGMDSVGPSRALEMAARCVVETGTSALYTTLQRLSPEPVLTRLTGLIRNDEVRHYKHFYRYFMRYRGAENPGRYAVLRILWGRIAEIEDEDGYYAFKHVFQGCHPERPFRRRDYLDFIKICRDHAKAHYPFEMAVKMFLKPLKLNRYVQRATVPLLSVGARHLLLR